MKNIGVIFCGYGTRDLVEQSLSAWTNLRSQYMGQFDRQCNIIICAVSVKFAGFDGADDGTRKYLKDACKLGEIDHLIDGPDNIPEVTARGMALNYLMTKGADTIFQWDSDEVSNVNELSRAFVFIDQHEFIPSFRFSYRNLVFSPDQWLEEPFTPMRVHRVNYRRYAASSFWDDNNILYRGTLTRDMKRDTDFPTMVIPPSILNPEHWTWISNERSRQKCIYQKKRWGTCSYKWNEVEDKLEFNQDYYNKLGIPQPNIVKKS